MKKKRTSKERSMHGSLRSQRDGQASHLVILPSDDVMGKDVHSTIRGNFDVSDEIFDRRWAVPLITHRGECY